MNLGQVHTDNGAQGGADIELQRIGLTRFAPRRVEGRLGRLRREQPPQQRFKLLIALADMALIATASDFRSPHKSLN